MSKYAHVICEDCVEKNRVVHTVDTLTDAVATRTCCVCLKEAGYGAIIHRHPDAMPCKGKHAVESKPH